MQHRIVETADGTYAIQHRFLVYFWLDDIGHEMGSYYATEAEAKRALERMLSPWIVRVVSEHKSTL